MSELIPVAEIEQNQRELERRDAEKQQTYIEERNRTIDINRSDQDNALTNDVPKNASNEENAFEYKPTMLYWMYSKICNYFMFGISFGNSNNITTPTQIIPSYWHLRYGLTNVILFIITMYLFINALFVYKLNAYNTVYCNNKINDCFSKAEQHTFDPLLYYLGNPSFKRMVEDSSYGIIYKDAKTDGFTNADNSDDYNLNKTMKNIYLAINKHFNNNIAFILYLHQYFTKLMEILNKRLYSIF
jgi:hypothetical protein